jgi:hypothetical protein
VDPILGSLVHQLPGGITLAYDLCLEHIIDRKKGIDEEIHFGGAHSNLVNFMEAINCEKSMFRPSKMPQKFKTQKTAKNSKLPTICFKLDGIGGWPPISTCIKSSYRHIFFIKMVEFDRRVFFLSIMFPIEKRLHLLSSKMSPMSKIGGRIYVRKRKHRNPHYL